MANSRYNPSTLPIIPSKGPCIYINDSLAGPSLASNPNRFASVKKLLSNLSSVQAFWHMQQPWNGKPLVSTTEAFIRGKDTAARLGLFIASHPPEDHHLNVQHAYEISESCADHDRRFLSVHLHAEGGGTPQNWKRWFGKRHLEVCVDERGADEFEEEVWKWLFNNLSPVETLWLLSGKHLREHDVRRYPEYTYAQLTDIAKHKRNAKLCFVAIVLDKPKVNADGSRLEWKVADKSGSASFYFQHRAHPAGTYTWNWVINLTPGPRVALPRMPYVLVPESTITCVLKKPFRLVGGTLEAAGHALGGLGTVVGKVGIKASWGGKIKGKWVPRDEADGRWSKVKGEKKGRVVVKGVREKQGEEGRSERHKVWDDQVFDERNEWDLKSCWEEDDEGWTTVGGRSAVDVGDEKRAVDFV